MKSVTSRTVAFGPNSASARRTHSVVPGIFSPFGDIFLAVPFLYRERCSNREIVRSIRLSFVYPTSCDVDFNPLLRRGQQDTGEMNRLLARQLDTDGLEVRDCLGTVSIILNWINTKAAYVGVDLDARCRLPLFR